MNDIEEIQSKWKTVLSSLIFVNKDLIQFLVTNLKEEKEIWVLGL